MQCSRIETVHFRVQILWPVAFLNALMNLDKSPAGDLDILHTGSRHLGPSQVRHFLANPSAFPLLEASDASPRQRSVALVFCKPLDQMRTLPLISRAV